MLPILAVLAPLSAPSLDCKHEVLYKTPLIAWQTKTPLLICDDGRHAITRDADNWRFYDLMNGHQRFVPHLWEVTVHGKTYMFPTSIETRDRDFDRFDEWNELGIHADHPRGPFWGYLHPTSNHSFIFPFGGGHVVVGGLAIFDLDQPSKGRIVLTMETTDSNDIPSSCLWDPASRMWLGLTTNYMQIWTADGRMERRIRYAYKPEYNYPSAFDWARRSAYSLVCRKVLPAVLYTYHLDRTNATVTKVRTDLPLKLYGFDVHALRSGKLLMFVLSDIWLSDASHRHWRKIGDSPVVGYSSDGKYLLLSGKSDDLWVERIDE